jgi:deoxyribodipyrimidine photo-lyase
MKTAIVWFRRDLRVSDHPALAAAARGAEAVVPVYVLSGWSGEHRWTGAPRQQFLCGCLASLAANLERLGGRLVLRSGDAVEALLGLAREAGAGAIYFHRDYDPHGRAVEERLRVAAAREGVELRAFADRVLHEPEEVKTGSGGAFKVFTPYSRAWLALAKPGVQRAPSRLVTPQGLRSEPLPGVERWGLETWPGDGPEPGEKAARQRLARFVAGPIFGYAEERNLPFADATSRLSPDLRHGTVSVREIYARCAEAMAGADARGRKGVQTFISEIAWREFYFSVLWHQPDVLEHEWNPKWRGLPWRENGEAFARWSAGETGFPIVDAAMRQLEATGWMHNRLRMIVAMFLTKDLHLDWRAGEALFMRRLVDGEIASNNGGWQWSAGTGADAAPYFRIQNPWSQTKRYDPDAAFIKRWLPELRDVPAAKLAEPPSAGLRLARGYPLPMVEHAAERDTCLERFAAFAASRGVAFAPNYDARAE